MNRPARAAVALCICTTVIATAAGLNELAAARDRQDLAAIQRIIAEYQQAAQQHTNAPDASYHLALAYSYGAEVAMELHDKKKSEELAEAGLDPIKKAISENDSNAEYHRLLGEICGQVIPANALMGTLKYGPCARDEIAKAIQLDPQLALAYVTRGVGNYYLPAGLGGGIDLALKDFDKAISLNPNLTEAYLWKGIALRKANRDAEARRAFEHALRLDPARVWTKEQLNKTPSE